MNKLLRFLLLSLSLVLIFTACSKKNNNNTTISNTNEYNNEIFTEDLYNSIIEIDFMYGDKDIIINNNNDLYGIYAEFASLKLEEPSDNEEPKDGHLIINMVTKNKTINIGLLSDEIIVDNIKFSVDKDIVSIIRNNALKANNIS